MKIYFSLPSCYIKFNLYICKVKQLKNIKMKKETLTAEQKSHVETLTSLLRFSANASEDVYEILSVLNSLTMAIEYKNTIVDNDISIVATEEFYKQCSLIDSLKVRVITAISNLR